VSGGKPLDRHSRYEVWGPDRYHSPHPPFMKVVSAVVSSACSRFVTFPLSYRLGHILFSCLGLTLVYALLAPTFGLFDAAFAILFILFEPRLFAEFLIGTTDGPMAIGWLVLSVLAWKIADEKSPRAGAV